MPVPDYLVSIYRFDPAHFWTTYIEVDPNFHINYDELLIDFTSYGNEAAYLHKDFGAGYFTDFVHKINVKIESTSLTCPAFVYVLSNAIGPASVFRPNDIDIWIKGAAPPYEIGLHGADGGGNEDTWSGLSVKTWYYLTITRSGTAVTCQIYSDSERTSLLHALVVVDSLAYRYREGCASENLATAGSARVYIYNPEFCTELDVDQDEVISFRATQTVGGEVAETTIIFDNEPKKEYAGGDIVEISVGYGESALAKVFSGEIIEANQESKDENKRLVLRARDWSFLFLTDKVSKSYPTAISARQIVIDILEGYILSYIKGQWHLNAISGGKVDDSSICGSHDGTVHDATCVAGKLNNCLLFDGTGDYVDLGDFCDFQRTEKFSIEFWIKADPADAPPDVDMLIAKMDELDPWKGWSVRLDDTGHIEFVLCHKFTAPDQDLLRAEDSVGGWNDNDWHHVIITYDGSISTFGVKFYIDGVLRGTTSVTNNLTDSIQTTANLYFGARAGPSYYYHGYLDEIVIYATVLTQAQVDSRYNKTNAVGDGTEVPLYPTSMSPCIRKVTICNVESTDQTRTVDFVGESIFDCLAKISSITVHDFYVNENKDLNWFPRLSRDSLKTLTNDDLEDYGVTEPYELLCNKVELYGKNNKPIPWDYDSWTDGAGPFGTWEELDSLTQSVSWYGTDKRAGDFSLRVDCDLIGVNMSESCVPCQTEAAPPKCNWNIFCVLHINAVAGSAISLKQVKFDYKGLCSVFGWNKVATRVTIRKGGWGGADLKVGEKTDPNQNPGWTTKTWGIGGIDPPPCDDPCSSGVGCLGVAPWNGDVSGDLYIIFWGTNWDYFCIGSPMIYMKNFVATYSYTGAAQNLGAILKLNPNYYVDLSLKQSPRKLVFSIYPYFKNINTGEIGFPTASIQLHFTDGTQCTSPLEFSYLEHKRWTTCEVPVGETAEGWIGGTPNKIVDQIIISVSNPAAADLDDYILIDWVHFDEAKWFGTYEDSGAGSSQEEYGVKFKEVFDDTCYSDTAAARIAKEYVTKFKVPISTVKDVIADFVGQQVLNPGEKITVDLPFEGIVTQEYRIESIIHELTEDLEYFTNQVLSLDPILFPGKVYLISERVRRLEQEYKRTPTTEATEVD